MTCERDDWVGLAAARGPVLVQVQGMTRRATLVAWEPNRDGRRRIGYARVQFASGRTATVRTHQVSLVPCDD
jgi:hypothetical protein